MIQADHPLAVTRRCALLDVARSTVYYRPTGISAEDLALMRRLDEIHLERPFYGSRRLRDELETQGHPVNRKRVQRLVRQMGLCALYPKPRTSQPAVGHTVYPYLLRSLSIERPNQVWATDICYIPMAHGFMDLVAIMREERRNRGRLVVDGDDNRQRHALRGMFHALLKLSGGLGSRLRNHTLTIPQVRDARRVPGGQRRALAYLCILSPAGTPSRRTGRGAEAQKPMDVTGRVIQAVPDPTRSRHADSRRQDPGVPRRFAIGRASSGPTPSERMIPRDACPVVA